MYSPFFVQGDLGFFQYKGKKYGQFFCAVQTFTKRVFAIPIRNIKSETLIDALETMLKVKNIFIFQNSNDLCLFLLFL